MEIKSVFDPSFKPYGTVLKGLDVSSLLERASKIEYKDGVCYEPSIESLEDDVVFSILEDNVYGGMPIQLGLCYGHNTKLNCLEYHRCSEINIGVYDFILLLAKKEKIEDGLLDTSSVEAFKVPAGTAVQLYETSLHYAPCQASKSEGFKVVIVLPRGTNTSFPEHKVLFEEDKLLRARNKWLLAHKESDEAKDGAVIGLTGENIDIGNII